MKKLAAALALLTCQLAGIARGFEFQGNEVLGQPQAVNSSQTDTHDHQQVSQEAAQLLYESAQLRKYLINAGDANDVALANRYWIAAGDFVGLVQEAPATEQRLFRSALYSYGFAIREQTNGLRIDPAVILAVQRSLAEQSRLINASLATGGWAESAIDVEIRALNRAGRPVNGLYVWLDLACCVRPNWSSNQLPRLTSPSEARVLPATYVIRLIDAGRPVAQREVTIEGARGSRVRVDVVLNDR